MKTAIFATDQTRIGTHAPSKEISCLSSTGQQTAQRESVLKTIFHPADFSESDQGAFEHALRLAVATKAQLTLLHAGSDLDNVHWSDFPRVRQTLERWELVPLGSSARDLAKLGLRIEKIKKAERDPVRATLDYVVDHRPNLIVLSTHQRHGLDRWFHKALAEPIARGAHTLTLFVPRGVPGFVSPQSGSLTLRNILIPVDSSPNPQHAIDVALSIPSLFRCSDVRFNMFHAGSRESLLQVNNAILPGCTLETTAWEGDPVDNILAASQAQEADLVVMATAGHHGFLDALRGSTTERLVRESRCPVLAVPIS